MSEEVLSTSSTSMAEDEHTSDTPASPPLCMAEPELESDSLQNSEITEDSAEIDFPLAIPAHEWYQYPPIEAGAPKPFDKTRLGRCPVEIHLKILEYLHGGYTICDLTEYDGRHAVPKMDLSYLKPFEGPLGTCRELRKEVLSIVTTTTSFHARDPQALLGFHVGDTHMSLIRFLQLDTSFGLRFQHEGKFPDLFDFLCTQLPNLMRFQLKSSIQNSDEVHMPENNKPRDLPGTTRRQQEVRSLLRFGAFLVKKHPNLDLLLWPSHSGPTFKEGEGKLAPGRPSLAQIANAYVRYYIDVVANTVRVDRKPCMMKLSEDATEDTETGQSSQCHKNPSSYLVRTCACESRRIDPSQRRNLIGTS